MNPKANDACYSSYQMAKGGFVMPAQSDRRHLKELLSCASRAEDTLNPAELQGFLHGLAITPEVIRPGEWLPMIFGEKQEPFANEAEKSLFHENFSQTFHYLRELHRESRLAFPYKLELTSEEVVNDALDWDYGFCLALEMRPEIWFGNRPENDSDEAVAELYTCFAVIRGLAYPEEAEEIFSEEWQSAEEESGDLELLATLLYALPDSVARIQLFAAELRDRQAEMQHI
jgi:yecA family protein